MGFFSTSPASPPPPKISSDGAPIAPDRSQRAKCWEARDAYFKCLDRNSIVDSIAEKDKAEKACSVEGRGFEGNCASSWVSSCLRLVGSMKDSMFLRAAFVVLRRVGV